MSPSRVSPPVDVMAIALALRSTAPEFGLGLAEAQANTLADYLALLHKWNAAVNLTAIREPQEMLVQHLFDCMSVVMPLRRELGDEGTVADIGSGGGLPGVVLAVMQPGWQVHCVDTVGKKASFVRQVAAELRIPNLHSVHSRVEDWRPPPVDLVTSRAFASLADFHALTRHLPKKPGLWAAMKGHVPAEEIDTLSSSELSFQVEGLQVPRLDAQRCLVWIRETPATS